MAPSARGAGARPIETPPWERFFSVSLETAILLFDRIALTDPYRGVDAARELTASLMPPRAPAGTLGTPQTPGPDPEVAWRSLTADVVGGDFYDVLIGPRGEVYVVIGDVSGSGPLAALFMAMTSCLMGILVQEGFPPGRMLELANKILHPHLSRRRMLITAQIARYHSASNTLALASAGHMWPYIMKKSGPVEVPLTGLPLGSMPTLDYPEIHTRVAPGQRLLLYTDGLIECSEPGGEMFGFERFTAALAEASLASAADLVESLLARFHAFVQDARRRDDVSLVAVAWS